MVQALKKKLKNEKGFTLIELLAVIVILGIIAAIAIPSINTMIQNSKVDGVRADAVAVYNAGKLYAAQHDDAATKFDGNTEDSSYLKGSVIDNTSLTSIKFKLDSSTGALTMSATAPAGSLKVTITNATYDQINNKANWTPASGAITIPAPAPAPAQ